MNTLEKRYEIFVREYLIDFNGTRAAIAAGYGKKSARVQASYLLTRPQVQELLAKFSKQKIERLDITAERVLGELARLAFFDPSKFFREDGTAIPINELDEDTRRAIAGIEVYEEYVGGRRRKGSKKERELIIGYTKKFKLADKGANLERLGRYLKLFTDRVELSGDPLKELIASLDAQIKPPDATPPTA